MKTKLNFLAAAMILAASVTGFGQSTIQFVTNSCSVPDWASSTAVPDWAGPLRLVVQRTNDLNTAVSVDYATADGTATNGLKYTATNGTLTFTAGETNKTIVVQLLDFNEGLVEDTKTFSVILNNPTNAVLGTPTTNTVSILNVDVGIQFQFTNYNAFTGWAWAEDVGTVLIGVVRGDDAIIPVTVDFGTSDVTATDGVDYLGFTNTLSFASTERLKFVPVTILNNTLKQSSRYFRATLYNSVGVSLGVTKTTRVYILDNDQGFQFESASYSVAEDAGAVLIGVLRGTDDTNATFSVDVATSDGTALTGVDYAGLTNTLTFAPGERRQVIPVPILNDGVQEGIKSFSVTLSNPTGGAVLGSPTTTTVYIQDNDPGVGFESSFYTTAWGQAGDFALIVLRGNDGALDSITVDYATSNLTATAGVDYVATNGTLTFKENETVKSLNIPILQPRAVGSAKTFRVTLSNPTGGATLGTSTTTVSIQGLYATVAPPYDCALTIQRESGVSVLSWAGGGQLQRADRPTGPWQTLVNVRSPFSVQSPVPTTFYRVTRPRSVKLYVPSSYTGQTNTPLVIMLHGLTASAAEYESLFRLTSLAEARGFLYCYPQGTADPVRDLIWNATDAHCDFFNSGVDDAGYLRGLIEEIATGFAVDRKRVHLFGAYSGGAMAYRMACQYADVIAGIASLCGTTFLDPGRCQPSEPVNVLHLHGTADNTLLYLGGTLNTSLQYNFSANLPPYPGAAPTVQMWAGYSGCACGPVTDPAPSLDLDQNVPGLDTVVTRHTACPLGGAVELWSIVGAGHNPFRLTLEFSPRVVDWLLAHPKQ